MSRASKTAAALAAAALLAGCEVPGKAKPEPEEDERGWSCERHGDRDCGPGDKRS